MFPIMKIFSGLLLLLVINFTSSLELDTNDVDSIHRAQALVARGLMDYYDGNDSGQTPGMFQEPYYWWEAGVAWGTMLDYVYYSRNDTYKDLVKTSLLFQTGDNLDYMPENQTSTEGNDDQGFWGITVMAAAENNFTNPGDGYPGWLYLAQAVFNTMADRWQTGSCGGGLRWQIYTWNSGYSYKNSVSNGCLFNIGARLARYTGNKTYFEWCEKVWDWSESVKFLDYKFGDDSLSIFDGADMAKNCSNVRQLEWTYNTGLFMSGCAFLYNMTEDKKWLDRADHIWNRAKVFFKNGKVMYEAACQPTKRCNNDQRTFKGIFSRLLGLTMKMAPTMRPDIMEKLVSSANAAAQSCSGGSDGHTCGQNWFYNGWDNMYGLGEQICALDLFNTLLIDEQHPPLTAKTGASSKGDGAAGTNSSSSSSSEGLRKLDLATKDVAGASIITAVVLIVMLGSTWWLLF